MFKKEKAFSFLDSYWFYVGFILKALLLLLIVYTDHISLTNFFEGIAKKGGDYPEQLGTIDNLVDYGTISQVAGTNPPPYAGRTPGFIFPYIFYRLFTSTFLALQIQVIMQMVLTVLASKCMYELILEYTHKKEMAWIAFFVVCSFNYITWVDFEVCPESFSNSSYIISMFFFNKYYSQNHLKYLLWSGMLIAWCFFLRGFTIPYALIFVGALAYIHLIKKKDYFLFIKASAIFLIPFVICVTIWTTRNYLQFERLIPLQNAFVPGATYAVEKNYNYVAKTSILHVRKLVSAWGGDCLWTYPKTEMNWMLSMNEEEAAGYKFKEAIFCKGFTRDSLEILRQLLRQSFRSDLSDDDHQRIEHTIVLKSDSYLQTFKNNNALIYAIRPLLRAKNFFNKNSVADWPIKKGTFIYYYKVLPLFLYYLIISIAFIGLFWLVAKKRMTLILSLFFGHILILLIEFGYFIELIQYRYFATAYLGCLFISVVFISVLMNKGEAKLKPIAIK